MPSWWKQHSPFKQVSARSSPLNQGVPSHTPTDLRICRAAALPELPLEDPFTNTPMVRTVAVLVGVSVTDMPMDEHCAVILSRDTHAMRIIDARTFQTRIVERFGSRGFAILPLAAGANVSIARLEREGMIGRHPAAVDQCLLVVSGRASVSGAEGSYVDIEPGQAAVWEAGEEHATLTDSGLIAVIVESEGLVEGLPQVAGAE